MDHVVFVERTISAQIFPTFLDNFLLLAILSPGNMNTEKPSKMITRLLQTIKEKDAKILELTASLTDKENTLVTTRLLLAGAYSSIKDLTEESDRKAVKLSWSEANAKDLVCQLSDKQRMLNAAVNAAQDIATSADREAARAVAAEQALADLQFRTSNLVAKESEIRVLVEKHIERMNKRERESASAILNRQALAGAVPSPNRR